MNYVLDSLEFLTWWLNDFIQFKETLFVIIIADREDPD